MKEDRVPDELEPTWEYVSGVEITVPHPHSGAVVGTRTDKMTIPGGTIYRVICTRSGSNGGGVAVHTNFVPDFRHPYR